MKVRYSAFVWCETAEETPTGEVLVARSIETLHVACSTVGELFQGIREGLPLIQPEETP